MRPIGFLHTSPVHTATFELLVAGVDDSIETATVVNDALLEQARRLGPEAGPVRSGINEALDRLVDAGARTIVCTCSTIAGQAETEGAARAIDVIRVDRPMIDAAVRIGGKITVLAALESTLTPTSDLLTEVAASTGSEVDVTMRLCACAWTSFEQGDLDRYLEIITAACDAAAQSSDVIVLAQASMARAADFFTGSTPVLSSPITAVRAAIHAERSHRRS